MPRLKVLELVEQPADLHQAVEPVGARGGVCGPTRACSSRVLVVCGVQAGWSSSQSDLRDGSSLIYRLYLNSFLLESDMQAQRTDAIQSFRDTAQHNSFRLMLDKLIHTRIK